MIYTIYLLLFIQVFNYLILLSIKIMNLNIGVSCWLCSDLFKLRRSLASLLVEPNIKPLKQSIFNFVKMVDFFDHFDFPKPINKMNLFIKICYNYITNTDFQFGSLNYVSYESNDMYKRIHLTNYPNRNTFESEIIDSQIFLLIFSNLKRLNFDIIKDGIKYPKIFFKTLMVYNYFNMNHKFNSITEYIQDLKKHGFTQINSTELENNIKISFLLDGISGFRYADKFDFIKRIQKTIFNKIPNNKYNYDELESNKELQDFLITYFNTQFKNDYTKELIEISKIYNEFKTFYNNIELIGSKYNVNAMINRNIYMEIYKENYVEFIDDDDFSCSIRQRYKQLVENITDYKFDCCNDSVNIINKELSISDLINDRKSRYEYVKKIFKLNNFNDTIKKELNNIIYQPDIFSHDIEKMLQNKFIETFRICGYGFPWMTIMPYCLNSFSLVGNVRIEDWVFGESKNKQLVPIKYKYLYVMPSNTSGDFKMYYDKFEILKNVQTNCLFALSKDKYKWVSKYGDDYYDFTDDIEYYDGKRYINKPVANLLY